MIKIAMVGTTGKKWHIVFNDLFTYCRAKPSEIDDVKRELSEVNHLCKNCRVQYLSLTSPHP